MSIQPINQDPSSLPQSIVNIPPSLHQGPLSFNGLFVDAVYEFDNACVATIKSLMVDGVTMNVHGETVEDARATAMLVIQQLTRQGNLPQSSLSLTMVYLDLTLVDLHEIDSEVDTGFMEI
ncbi:MAG: hypothetical protein AAF639_14900 [Chloroflexota bacterium]